MRTLPQDCARDVRSSASPSLSLSAAINSPRATIKSASQIWIGLLRLRDVVAARAFKTALHGCLFASGQGRRPLNEASTSIEEAVREFEK
jgi:hypothetical protein